MRYQQLKKEMQLTMGDFLERNGYRIEEFQAAKEIENGRYIPFLQAILDLEKILK